MARRPISSFRGGVPESLSCFLPFFVRFAWETPRFRRNFVGFRSGKVGARLEEQGWGWDCRADPLPPSGLAIRAKIGLNVNGIGQKKIPKNYQRIRRRVAILGPSRLAWTGINAPWESRPRPPPPQGCTTTRSCRCPRSTTSPCRASR